jgi:hypothetical protein
MQSYFRLWGNVEKEDNICGVLHEFEGYSKQCEGIK